MPVRCLGMLPRAIIHSTAARAWSAMRWLGQQVSLVFKIGLLAAFTAFGFGLTQVGCRNDAITYAHAIYDNPSCSAIHTCAYACAGEEDVAICKIGKPAMLVRCVASFGGYRDPTSVCTKVFDQ